MEAYGRSKHADQLKTKEERSTLKANGVPFEQYRNIDYTRDYIYSHNTMKNYQHHRLVKMRLLNIVSSTTQSFSL